MKIIVLLRAVHEAPDSDKVLPIMSPCDRAALHTALALEGDHEVTALCSGPAPDEAVLQLALDAGAARAILLSNPLFARCTVETLGGFIALGIQHLGYDLVLSGQHSLDWGSGGTGPTVAHFLHVPHVTSVISVKLQGDEIAAEQLREDGILSLVLPIPSLLAVAAGPASARTPAIVKGASEESIEHWDPGDLNLTLPSLRKEPEISLENTTPLPAVEFMDASSLLAELTRVGLLP